MKIYTGGTFDLFHAGHVRLLARCHEFANGGEVVVALNTDEFIAQYKGKPPVCSYRERAEVLLACRYVSRVIPNVGGADSKPAIETVRPDVIVIGSDWATKNYHQQMGFDQAWLDHRGIALAYVPYTAGISSTRIKGQMA